MSSQALVRELFAPPGAAASRTRHLLAQAAGAHAKLLNSARAAGRESLASLREGLIAYLRGPAPATRKRLVLDDPLFVEALHALAGTSQDLSDWDALVAPGCYRPPPEREAALARGRLGNVLAGVLLPRRRTWCGCIDLATDDYGRVHLPFCDWSLVATDAQADGLEPFAHQPLVLELGPRLASWRLPSARTRPWITMPRALFDTMFVDNRDVETSPAIDFAPGPPSARFERATPLGTSGIRYEPIVENSPALHAQRTRAILAAVLAAIEQNAPAMHGQLCQSIRKIQSFELPPYGGGRIASFSIPSSPGVIGFNVPYTSDDEPQLSPYCFLWLAHELGHTLHYLIEDVAYAHGWRFLENPSERTPLIPRYGRSLAVRTLFQVPYVHLFEWWLLMRFIEHRFAGLPWQIEDDSRAVGEDLRAEIAEAFEGIDEHAHLTSPGRDVVNWLHELVAEADWRWQRLGQCTAT